MSHDEHGRPISPDGVYAWDGAQWVRRAPASPPQPVPAPAPAPAPAHLSPDGRWAWDGTAWQPVAAPVAAPYAAASPGIDLDAEVRSYPITSRTLRGALFEIPQHLEVGEAIVATAPGASWIVRMSVTHAALLGNGSTPGVIAAATDRRLLVCGYGGMGGSLTAVVGVPYDTIASWRPGKRGAVFRSSQVEGQLEVEQLAKAKAAGLLAAVEARLAAGVVQR